MAPASSSEPAKDEILAYLAHGRFHHELTLPATPSHGEVHVAYSVIGVGADDFTNDGAPDKESSSKIPTIIWAGAMFATRYQGVYGHHFASEKGVRVVYVDRPGIGRSDPVPLNQRIPVWLETVPRLMQLLNVEHVVLASHSAGTVYQMNVMHHLRNILSPSKPYVAFFGPWVHPDHSGVALLSTAKLLPSSLISQFSSIQSFIIKNVNPTIGFSSSVFSGISTAILPRKSSSPSPKEVEEEKMKTERYGMNKKQRELLDKYGFPQALAEGTHGVDEEALLCLKKIAPGTNGKPANWDVAEDFNAFVKSLVLRERERLLELSRQGAERHRLKVDAFFGESDFMIGKKGDQYFRDCWDRDAYKDAIEWEGAVLEGSNHDNVIEVWRKGIEKLFEEAKRSLS